MVVSWVSAAANSVGEIAGLSILDDRRVYYIDHTESLDDVQVRDWTGEYAPLHAVPSGLVMLADVAPATDDEREGTR